MKFNEATCEECGVCLVQCPFLELSIDQAKEEISQLIKSRSYRKIIKNCAGCAYCNVICPTQSNPSELIREIRLKGFHERGISKLALINEEIPDNLMYLCFEAQNEEKRREIENYKIPSKSNEMFYLGCGVPYLYPDLAQTKLLEDLPKLGGLENCCNGYVYNFFGEEEAKVKGTEFFERFKALDVKKLITFCPDCEKMIKGVYPAIINGFNIEGQNIVEYFIEKYHRGELNFKNKINQRVTFQDPCPWRSLDKKVYNGPREFLEIIGAEVVEMKHTKEKSLCCGAPIATVNRDLGKKISKMNIAEAKSIDADAISFLCSGCLFRLSPFAKRADIEPYYITELAQMAIGEKPIHKIIDATKKIENYILKRVMDNPRILREKYTIKNGKFNQV